MVHFECPAQMQLEDGLEVFSVCEDDVLQVGIECEPAAEAELPLKSTEIVNDVNTT